MSKKMLIDATHHEETRVAIVEDGRLEEFDYESTFRKALKGSIFLAKVTRVEPSLQAAFVNFGGNRHGFLPFSEIHPDYFRIPIADREALIAEQEAALKEMEEEEEAEDLDIDEDAEVEQEDEDHEDDDHDDVAEVGGDVPDPEDEAEDKPKGKKAASKKSQSEQDDEEPGEPSDEVLASEDEAEDTDGDDEEDESGNNKRGRYPRRGGRGGRGRGRRNAAHNSRQGARVEENEMDAEQRFRFKMRRKYKIQEVVKRGQIMLVQVSKEERGNKGAAVGSYLSLPGRYCVLMPNSPRAGGVSRKISNYKDRAKMRELLKDLEVPKGMSVILRTAGVTRTKAEVKRDLEYLLRLWNNIVDLTKESYAPALVYEEANLVKRAVRDLYTRDVDEIIVSGDEGFKTARDFMKMMIPSHVKRVKEFKSDKESLFQKHGVESQISEIGETTVRLKSGGYLVINPTEALVSIDVNSGKATKERHIEETALKTNLEAAEEVARQLRLRDLGGLVVIDFIDMEDRRNNGKVERKMREALSGDRARIQVGRISSFGLMEMSRQRMNPSLSESQFETCSHCAGTGRTRTADAASIMLLRAIEEEAAKGRAAQVIVHVSNAVALYLLNQKRSHLTEIEARYSMSVLIRVDDDMGAAGFRIEVSKPADKGGDDTGDDTAPPEENKNTRQRSNNDDQDDNDGDSKRRRGRRGGRRRGGRGRSDQNDENNQNNDNNKQGDELKGNKKPDDESKGNKKPSDDIPEVNGNVKPDPNEGLDANGNVKDDGKKKPSKPRAAKKDVKKDEKKDEKKADKPKDEKPKPSKAKEAPAKSKKQEASNDDGTKDEKPMTKAKDTKEEKSANKDYEVVNEAPGEKKKGWWNRGN